MTRFCRRVKFSSCVSVDGTSSTSLNVGWIVGVICIPCCSSETWCHTCSPVQASTHPPDSARGKAHWDAMIDKNTETEPRQMDADIGCTTNMDEWGSFLWQLEESR
mmetsp:Transcript_113030/g.200361  ORF Transcript_113030/g.200361 Transcript_113030/m.200361 type:complete len:106 (+) Transcript_113030:990-1307(+)